MKTYKMDLSKDERQKVLADRQLAAECERIKLILEGVTDGLGLGTLDLNDSWASGRVTFPSLQIGASDEGRIWVSVYTDPHDELEEGRHGTWSTDTPADQICQDIIGLLRGGR